LKWNVQYFFMQKKNRFICRTWLYLYKKPITNRGDRYSFVTIFSPLSKRHSCGDKQYTLPTVYIYIHIYIYTNALSVIGAKQIATCTKSREIASQLLYDKIIKVCLCAVRARITTRGWWYNICDSVRLIRGVQRTRLIYNLPYNK